jgi:hypothetical protein
MWGKGKGKNARFEVLALLFLRIQVSGKLRDVIHWKVADILKGHSSFIFEGPRWSSMILKNVRNHLHDIEYIPEDISPPNVKLFLCTPWRHMVMWRYNSTHSFPQHWMQINVQHQDLGALPTQPVT